MVLGEFGQINPINELMNMKPTLPIYLKLVLGLFFNGLWLIL